MKVIEHKDSLELTQRHKKDSLKLARALIVQKTTGALNKADLPSLSQRMLLGKKIIFAPQSLGSFPMQVVGRRCLAEGDELLRRTAKGEIDL